MNRARLLAVATAIAVVFLSLDFRGAYAQQTARHGNVAAAPHGGQPARVTNSAHVYLMRGLMNVFSLGMDSLAQKIEQRGIAATVHNHTLWQAVANEIAARYQAGNRGPVILVGHSLGADAVMQMGQYLGGKGVPVALIVPFDGTGSYSASPNVARVLNITQRRYAHMRRGPGFRGELVNFDVSGDQSVGHFNIDKLPTLQAMVVNKIMGVVGGRRPASPVRGEAKTADAAKLQAGATSVH